MSTAAPRNTRLARLRDILARHVDRGARPASCPGEPLRRATHVGVIGSTAVDGRTPVRADTVFRISAMTKPATAVATLILLTRFLAGESASRAARGLGTCS